MTLGHAHPLIAFLDQHDRDVIYNGIFTGAILADEPGVLVQFEFAPSGADAIRATQNFDQCFANH